MQVTAHFTRIKYQLIEQLHKASRQILLAVAWLTDEDLIRELAHQQKKGISVTIAISNAKENFFNTRHLKEFIRAGGQLYIASPTFLHHKFCLIDHHILINGSYNWSYFARTHEENITILEGEPDRPGDQRLFEQFRAKHAYLCNKCSFHVGQTAELDRFRSAVDPTIVVSLIDEKEITLRRSFQEAIQRSFQQAMALKIPISPLLLERMEQDGGGVEFVKRILHDEMTSGDMKSGFKKLEEQIPHKVELSLEYLVAQPAFQSLFTTEKLTFCQRLMAKYHL